MTEPIRVLYEIHPHTLGGTERFLARFLGQLDRRRYKPIVISQKKGLPLQMIDSLDIQTESMSDYFRASGIRRLADFILRTRVSLVQSNYYTSQLAIASNLAGVPHVWRLGGHVDVGSGTRTATESQWALNIIRLLSKSIICNSKYVRTQFRGRSRSPRIHVIPNGISTPVRLYQERKNQGFSVGMIAHFTPQKRHIDFIHAAELVSASREDVSFTILGMSLANSESRSYATEVERRAQSLLRQGKLTISEFAECGSNVLSKFNIVVLPSVRESFSNAILESMAAGIPVIAANSGGHPELVAHRATGLLVPPLRPEALAKAILLLVKNPKLLGRMGQAGQEMVKTRFSMSDCVGHYEDVYSRVIAAQALSLKGVGKGKGSRS